MYKKTEAAKTAEITFLVIESMFDKEFVAPDVPMSKMVSHQKWQEYLYEIGNKPGMRVLEIGSREVTGTSNARNRFAKAKYVGFDFYPDNVDIVGDAHKLSSYFEDEEQLILYIQAPALSILRCLGLLRSKLQKYLKWVDMFL